MSQECYSSSQILTLTHLICGCLQNSVHNCWSFARDPFFSPSKWVSTKCWIAIWYVVWCCCYSLGRITPQHMVSISWHLIYHDDVWLMFNFPLLTFTGPINWFMRNCCCDLRWPVGLCWWSDCENKWLLDNDLLCHPADRKTPFTWLYIIMVLSSNFCLCSHTSTHKYQHASAHTHAHRQWHAHKHGNTNIILKGMKPS